MAAIGRASQVVLVVVLLVAGSLLALYVLWPRSPSPAGTAHVELTIARNSSGSFVYSSNSVDVPAGAWVAFTIVNYDPTNHSAPWRYCNVTGTYGNMMDESGGWRMGGGMMGSGGRMGALAPNEISHTFTIRSGAQQFNVPIPAARSPADPSVTTFSVRMGGAGVYGWACMADGMPEYLGMGSGMSGVLTVS